MRIIGIGTDIVQISRIQNALDKHGARFAERILHPQELAIYHQHTHATGYLAKRFAAKEALAKALGTGIGKHVKLTEIETHNNAQGKPNIRLHQTTAAFAEQQRVAEIHLSLADERDYALAYVVLSG